MKTEDIKEANGPVRGDGYKGLRNIAEGKEI